MIGQIWMDKTGKVSAKRVFGSLLVVAAIVGNFLGLGDPSTTHVMLWSGVASLGVGTLETKVSK
jgi:hypothetical protein